MAITRTQSVTDQVSGGPTSSTLTISAPANGSLIVTALAGDKDIGAITVPTGFTRIGTDYTSHGFSVSRSFAYKVSDGTETSIVWNWVGSTGTDATTWAGVYTGTAAAPLDVHASNAPPADGSGTSQTSGTTATTTQAEAVAIAFVVVDSGVNWPNVSWTNSFSVVEPITGTAGGQPGIAVSERFLSATGAYSTSASTTGTSDQTAGAIAVFKELIGATSLTRTQSVTNDQTTIGATSNAVTIVAPASGSLIVTALAGDKSLGTVTVPPGFTRIGSNYVGASVTRDFAYKISNGAETSVTWTYSAGTGSNSIAWVGVYTGNSPTPLDRNSETDTNNIAVGTLTIGPTAETTQANEHVIAFAAADSKGNFTGPFTWNAAALDTFTRTVASGWSTAEAGGPYRIVAATGTTSVTGTKGSVVLGASQYAYFALDSVVARDQNIKIDFSIDKIPTTNSMYLILFPRFVSDSTQYWFELKIPPGGISTAALLKNVSGVSTVLAAHAATGITHSTATDYSIRAEVLNVSPTTFRYRIWPSGDAEPTTWLRSVSDSEASLQVVTKLGLGIYTEAIGNAPITVLYDNLGVNETPGYTDVVAFAGSNAGLAVAEKALTTTQTVSASWSAASGTDQMAGAIATFKTVAPGGGGTTENIDPAGMSGFFGL